MKKHILLLLVFPLLFGCTADKVNNNPYLPNYSFSLNINLSLPTYADLNYTTGSYFYESQGLRGIIIFNTGTGYVAFDAACPNQALTSCSKMTLTKGDIKVVCPCDNAEYSLFTGQSTGKQYAMKQYRVEQTGTMLRIYN
jgi:nitrite reductase/ring-hydroxylating ferredoxin subunit